MSPENRSYWLRAVGLWFLLMVAETLHGVWRMKVLAPWIGDAAARDVSVFTGSLVILLIYTCVYRMDSGAKRTNATARWVHLGGPNDCLRTSSWTFRVPSFLGRDHLGFRRSPREIASNRPSVSDVLASSCRATAWPNG